MLSKEFIDKVKKAVNMVELAKQYAEIKIAGSGIWQGACPHPDHQDDTPSFVVWEKSQSWACMGCHSGKKDSKYKNYGSDCVAFIQWIEGFSWSKSVTFLAEMHGIELEKSEHEEVYVHNSQLAKSYNRNLSQSAINYLKERACDKKDLTDFLVGFDGSRITYPLLDNYRRVQGFSKRKFIETNKSSPKYRNSSNSNVFNKSSYLYGIHLLNDDSDEIRITEGAMDVIVPVKYGVKNITATLGTAFTKYHIALIKNSKKTPVFCMDGDEAGLKSVKRSIDMLSEEGVYSKVLILPKDKDMADIANEYKYETEDYIRDNSVTYGQLMIQDLINQYDSKMNEMKIKLLPEVKDILGSISNQDELKVISSYVYEKMGLKL